MALAASVVAVAGDEAKAAPVAAPPILYVDCSLGNAPGGRGSPADPIRDLDTLNVRRLTPGTHVRFKRGAVCHGVFRPADGSSGSARSPIVVEAYGDPRARRPVIAAGCRRSRPLDDAVRTADGVSPYPSLCLADDGGPPRVAAIHLKNVEYWEIRHLELTNDALTPGARQGLLVELADFGTGHHYRVDDVYVHHVRGQLKNEGEGDTFAPGKMSGGIQFRVTRAAPASSGERPTNFDDVRVENSEIFAVDLIGLSIWSEWMCRPISPMCKDVRPYNANYRDHRPWTPAAYAEWYPSTNVVFRNNRLHDIGGDGVIIRVSRGAKVESNLVYDIWMRAMGNSAGLWAINADETLFRYNEVYGVRLQHGIEPGDGMAFDADMGTVATRFVANYSHDNAGGLMLFCGCSANEGKRPAETIATAVDSNFSLDDGRRAVTTVGATAGVVRGNVVVTTMAANTPILENVQRPTPSEVRFEDNRFYALGGASDVARLKSPNGDFAPLTWTGNLFAGDWAVNLPGGVDKVANRFESTPAGPPKAAAARLFDDWARASGFAANRYRPPKP